MVRNIFLISALTALLGATGAAAVDMDTLDYGKVRLLFTVTILSFLVHAWVKF